MQMTTVVSQTDLTRKTRQIVDRARRGYTVIVESHGHEQVVMIDAMDYRIVSAVVAWQGLPPHPAPINDETQEMSGLSEAEVAAVIKAASGDEQARWNRVVEAYLDGHINLGRAANLLQVSRYELETRFRRLGVALRLGPETIQEAQAEAQTVRQWHTGQ
jgi:predicted HTH domain antitoxin